VSRLPAPIPSSCVAGPEQTAGRHAWTGSNGARSGHGALRSPWALPPQGGRDCSLRLCRASKVPSHFDPNLLPLHLAPKAVHRLPAHRGAAAASQLEPPLVDRADGFALVDPAEAERPVFVRATAQQGEKPAAVVEDSNPEPVHLDRQPTALDHVARA